MSQRLLQALVKLGAPVWTHVPGTPFSLPGTIEQNERLPSMSEWVPRPMIERIGRGMDEGMSTDQLVDREVNTGWNRKLPFHSVLGATGGGVLARVLGGEKITAPFRGILQEGLNKETLSKIKGLPTYAKALPFVGVGAGAAASLGRWAANADTRRRQAIAANKGIETERFLQVGEGSRALNHIHALEHRLRGDTGRMKKLPHQTARQEQPLVVSRSGASV